MQSLSNSSQVCNAISKASVFGCTLLKANVWELAGVLQLVSVVI